jgi:phenylalanine-4-hydroxylase
LTELKGLVEEIKKQKATYCAEYEQYDRDSRTLWRTVTQSEQKQKFASRMRAVYLEEAAKLQQLENAFRNSSQEVTALLAH